MLASRLDGGTRWPWSNRVVGTRSLDSLVGAVVGSRSDVTALLAAYRHPDVMLGSLVT
jgi:hypothetical protein